MLDPELILSIEQQGKQPRRFQNLERLTAIQPKSAPATVKLTTEPSLDRIVPYEAEAETAQQPVRLTLQAIDSTGKPLANVRMKVKLMAPDPTPWFTTDFPIVEGTKLLEDV